MLGSEFTCFSFWWMIPVMLMIFCFLMMKGRRWPRMCGYSDTSDDQTKRLDTAIEIIQKRYASGEINKDEYQEIKKALTDSTVSADECA